MKYITLIAFLLVFISCDPEEIEPDLPEEMVPDQIEFVEVDCQNRLLPCKSTIEFYSTLENDSARIELFYEYDSLDRIIRYYSYSTTTDFFELRVELTYLDDSTIPFEMDYYRDDAHISKQVIEIDYTNGLILSTDFRSPNGSSSQPTPDKMFTYDDSLRLINTLKTSIFSTRTFSISDTYYYTGNLADSMIRKTTEEATNLLQMDTTHYEYTSLVNQFSFELIELNVIRIVGSNSGLQLIDSEQKNYTFSGQRPPVFYEYQFDENDNLIRCNYAGSDNITQYEY